MDVIAKDWSETTGGSAFTYTVTEKLVDWTKVVISGIFDTDDKASLTYNIKNNLVVIKTESSLKPYLINRGVQEVSGDISIYEARLPNYDTVNTYAIFIPSSPVTFNIQNWSVSHLLVNHWTFRTPLSPDMVITTLDWTRVDTLPSPPPA